MIKKVIIFICFIVNLSLYAQNSEAYNDVIMLFKIEFEEPDKAIEIGNKILNNPKATYLEQSYAFLGIGSANSIKGKPSLSIPYYLKGIELAEKTDNYELRVNANLGFASLYTKMKLYEQSYQYLENAQREAKKLSDRENQLFFESRILAHLGQNLNLQEKHSASIESLKKSLNLANEYMAVKKKESMVAEYSFIYSSIGETYYDSKQWDKAENAFGKVIDLFKKNNGDSQFEKAYSYNYLGKIYYHRKEYQRAADTLLVAAKSNDDKRSYIQADLYYSLSQAYEKLDDKKLSNQYNQLYLSEKSKISDEEKTALSESLKNELRISKEQEEKKRFNLVLFLSIIAVIIGLGTFVVIRLLNKKKEEKLLFQKSIEKLKESVTVKDNTSQEITSQETTSQEIKNQSLKTKKTISSATEDTENKLLQKLEKFEKSEAFLNPKVSLSTMASQFNTNQSYISELINSARNKSFNQYINDLRIDYICKKIYEDSVYQNYKISHLAELCGYPSHTTFTKIFKKVTGISPSIFIANAKELD